MSADQILPGIGLISNAGIRFAAPGTISAQGRFEDVHRGGYDPEQHPKDMALDGVAGEVLYPSQGLFYFKVADTALMSAIFRAYNDWLAEFCRTDPARLKGIAMINLDDIGDAIKELERAARLGLAGAMITEYPAEDRRYDQPECEPFWAATALDLPLSLHTATRRQGKIRRAGPGALRDASNRATKAFYPALSMCDMIFSGVFAAPERPGARPDPLVVAAQERGLTVHRHAKYSSDEAKQALAELNADLGVMAYVLLFAPPEFCAIPKSGMIQFHPSLLPLHRGPSSIPWAIIRGRNETGLSIFRPTPGLDEGPVILQKRVPIGPDETAGSLYFDKIFPLGVEALVQAADLVVSGRATETTQDEARATYEGWVREAESRINWATHVDFVYDLIRGCNPAPGAWTMAGERKLYLFDARKITAPTFGAVRGRKIGEVVSVGEAGMRILAEGGFVEVSRVRIDDGAKIAATDADIAEGTVLGG